MRLPLLLFAFFAVSLACRLHTAPPPAALKGRSLQRRESGPRQHTAWPKNNDQVSAVTHCYANEESYAKLYIHVERGWYTWLKKIGPNSSHYGHTLFFTAPRVEAWCYLDEAETKWNPYYANYTLVIKVMGDDAIGGEASTGYTSDKTNHDAGRHYMYMGGAASDWDFAHELGHVFGLLHEHQRPDRDDYVTFSCDNMYGFDDAWKRAEGKFTKADFCSKSMVGRPFGFQADEFSKDDSDSTVTAGISGPVYDFDSIMHYTSDIFSDPAKTEAHPKDASYYPLAKIDKTGEVTWRIIPPPKSFPELSVSDGDRDAIVALYRWL
ncbi:hypothetical protein CC80DRAFT_489827 [Byssothecium circinans]|uniref:Metalloendopeptidase n=1 Tax=Byssothecium circinans TaxID=147558 RepID=A0A6A5UA32_9PLEO|nr:hypothetical protein CC80DRAFT_489827 [Byssothecium circinans]